LAEEKYLEPEEIYLFNHGQLFHSYLRFGAHKVKLNNRIGVHFAVWAPNAKEVNVVGSFNHWHGEYHRMERQGETGVWTLFIPGLEEGVLYKYEITDQNGLRRLKADPFAFFSEYRPNTASLVYSLDGYAWGDNDWMAKREDALSLAKPMLIYEVHLGSWKRRENDAYYSYSDYAEELVAYVKDMGFTHLELLPIMEHPFDGSWGYQITGYYAPTSRYGSPRELMFLIDKCHQAGIAVILDWVPGHFCKDDHGLAVFDGTPLFEAEEHGQWGTFKFNFSRKEVWSFLISNALFWFDIYHIDGLRVDGVTSMLRLDFGRAEGQWKPNALGGRENPEAVAFLQELNKAVFSHHPYVLMMAEESTDWPFVTRPAYDGGLGFNYKWNMGWMNDTLKYMQTPFPARPNYHNLLTFSLVYAFSENFILPFSHDEVVHGKKSLIERMPGEYWQKFAGLRLLYLYQICHPGKKLLFMGGEFGQFIEWRFYSGLEWFLLDYAMHRQLQDYVKELNRFYQREKSLWEIDHDWNGFEWIDVHNGKQGILIFLRKALDPKNYLIILINCLPVSYECFRIGVPGEGVFCEAFNSDALSFGGSGLRNADPVKTEPIPWHGKQHSINLKIPPLAGVILRPV